MREGVTCLFSKSVQCALSATHMSIYNLQQWDLALKKTIDRARKKKFSISFSAVGGVSHGLLLTLFHPYVAQECILEVH